VFKNLPGVGVVWRLVQRFARVIGVKQSFFPVICLGFGVWGTRGQGAGLAGSYLC